MFKFLKPGWSLITVALVFLASSAYATPTLYEFTSGSVQLRAINTTTGESVLSGSTVVTVPLGGTFVLFDPAGGTDGTILDLQFTALNTFSLDLDPLQAALDEITVANAMVINATGTPDATADVTSSGTFFLDTEMSADVSGVFPDMTPYPSTYFQSVTSGVEGTLAVSDDTLQLGLFGVTFATFGTVTNPTGNEIEVKADYFFVSTVVPEPGTALLMAMGLAGLSSTRSRRAQ